LAFVLVAIFIIAEILSTYNEILKILNQIKL